MRIETITRKGKEFAVIPAKALQKLMEDPVDRLESKWMAEKQKHQRKPRRSEARPLGRIGQKLIFTHDSMEMGEGTRG